MSERGVEYDMNDLIIPQNRDDDLVECIGAALNVVTFALLAVPVLGEGVLPFSENFVMASALGNVLSPSLFFVRLVGPCDVSLPPLFSVRYQLY